MSVQFKDLPLFDPSLVDGNEELLLERVEGINRAPYRIKFKDLMDNLIPTPIIVSGSGAEGGTGTVNLVCRNIIEAPKVEFNGALIETYTLTYGSDHQIEIDFEVTSLEIGDYTAKVTNLFDTKEASATITVS